eukprot:s4490_g1.t1
MWIHHFFPYRPYRSLPLFSLTRESLEISDLAVNTLFESSFRCQLLTLITPTYSDGSFGPNLVETFCTTTATVDTMGQVMDTCCGAGETGAGTDASADVVPGLVGAVTGGPQISASAIKSLKDMGFNEVASRNALEACNGNLEEATQLLLNSSMAEPEPVPAAPMAPPRSEQSPEKLAQLVGMGFTEQQAHDALDGSSGNLERAIEYLMASAK